MTRTQLISLGYFTSVSRCNRVLRRLFDRQYLQRHFLPEAPYGAQTIYTIGKAAAPLVAAHLEQEVADVIEQSRRGTPAFLTHCLAIVDVRIAFQEAVKLREDVSIERWIPEMLCRDEYQVRTSGSGDSTWCTEVFRPDGFVQLKQDGRKPLHGFFLEIDLGHTSSKQFVGKLNTHEHYLKSGLFAEVFDAVPNDEFNTLVVTTGNGRLSNLCDLVEQNASRLFWFTTFEAIRSHGALGPIWRVPGHQDRHGLL